ncbi:Alpha-(1,3)-fucosyltransferase C [Nymphon striatum]|nr:Alpha-(1,3)-fucosyltransferase C [Nymphon striatum]
MDSESNVEEEQENFEMGDDIPYNSGNDQDLSQLVIDTVKPVVILLWNKMFVGIPGDLLVGKQSFTACKNLPCSLTIDKAYESSADAIIMPWSERVMFSDVPNRVKQDQIIVFEAMEGPLINARPADRVFDKYRGIFNWTMTYRDDADVKKSYGEFHFYDIGERPPLGGIRNLVENKTKVAAWFVANTATAFDRFNYVKELQKYIQIDIYGPNQKLKCPTSLWGECLEMVDLNYKFYLSFENTFAKDYITEKMFSHIGRPVVPVVLGGANYKKLFPPHSYIDSSYFKSPKDLAKYLLLLDKNTNLYMEYFEWIRRGIFKFHQPQWCNLCIKLLTRKQGETKYYNDIYKWYYDQKYWFKKFTKVPSRFEIDNAFNYN